MKKVAIPILAILIVISLFVATDKDNRPATSNSYNYTNSTKKDSTYSQTTEITTPSSTNNSTSNSFSSNNNKNATIGETNALASAKIYLNSMAFSYSGLIEQLEFEGYTNSDATYAANNCGADWYEQAALSAKTYLNVMPFSRDGLIEQLQYEGFTYEQAAYGAEQNGY